VTQILEIAFVILSLGMFGLTLFNTGRQVAKTPVAPPPAPSMTDAQTLNAMLLAEIEPLRFEMRVTNQWVQMLVVQVVQMGGQPVTHADAERAYKQMLNQPDTWAPLRAVLAGRFDYGELRALMSDCGWRIENIAGESVPLPDVATRIVEYAKRRGAVELRARPRAPEWTNAE
jgi:hypothetical protein